MMRSRLLSAQTGWLGQHPIIGDVLRDILLAVAATPLKELRREMDSAAAISTHYNPEAPI
jgi:hypothetical protein